MRMFLIALFMSASTQMPVAAQEKMSLGEACNIAVIVASGILPKTGPSSDHLTSAKFCLDAVDAYVAEHCPVSRSKQSSIDEIMWSKVQAVGRSTAVDDAHAITAACP